MISNTLGFLGFIFGNLFYFVNLRDSIMSALDAEHEKSESLLLNVLLRSIVERLKRNDW